MFLCLNFLIHFLSSVSSVLWHCWLGVRKSIWAVKIEWWGVGMVICLQRGADCLHMVQLMPLHSTTWPYQSSLFCCNTNSMSSTPSLSLSSLLGSLSFSLTPHIHLTILISARWSATTFELAVKSNQIKYDFNNGWQTANQLQLVKRDKITANKRRHMLNRNVNTSDSNEKNVMRSSVRCHPSLVCVSVAARRDDVITKTWRHGFSRCHVTRRQRSAAVERRTTHDSSSLPPEGARLASQSVCTVVAVVGLALSRLGALAGGPSLSQRYDTRCYFKVRSKADISQLNLPHGTDN